jgi:hypothetical protein
VRVPAKAGDRDLRRCLGMSEHDSFEDRVREIADQISRSMQRMADVDLEQLADAYGVDVDRARGLANAAGQWLNDRLAGGEPFFGEGPTRDQGSARQEPGSNFEPPQPQTTESPRRPTNRGPHPLDLPTDWQGLALSALDSRRWTVRPGSNQLTGTGDGPPPPEATDAPDLVGDLRARDWITADGGLTLVGRHALARWCRAADKASLHPDPDAPQTDPDETAS